MQHLHPSKAAHESPGRSLPDRSYLTLATSEYDCSTACSLLVTVKRRPTDLQLVWKRSNQQSSGVLERDMLDTGCDRRKARPLTGFTFFSRSKIKFVHLPSEHCLDGPPTTFIRIMLHFGDIEQGNMTLTRWSGQGPLYVLLLVSVSTPPREPTTRGSVKATITWVVRIWLIE